DLAHDAVVVHRGGHLHAIAVAGQSLDPVAEVDRGLVDRHAHRIDGASGRPEQRRDQHRRWEGGPQKSQEKTLRVPPACRAWRNCRRPRGPRQSIYLHLRRFRGSWPESALTCRRAWALSEYPAAPVSATISMVNRVPVAPRDFIR